MGGGPAELCAARLAMLAESWHPTGLGLATAARYRRTIDLLVAFAEASNAPFDQRLVRAFLSRWKTPRCRTQRLSAIRAFCHHALTAGELAAEVGWQVVHPKIHRDLPRVLSVDACQQLVTSRGATSRERAILELLYGTGIHAQELVALELDDVELQHRDRLGRLHVRGRDRPFLPVGREAVRAIRAYLVERGLESGALFVERVRRITVSEVRRIVRHHGRLVLERDDLTPKILRASFAAHLLDGGAEVPVVQVLMGHRTIASTLPYVRLAIDRLTRVYDRAHPLARRASVTRP